MGRRRWHLALECSLRVAWDIAIRGSRRAGWRARSSGGLLLTVGGEDGRPRRSRRQRLVLNDTRRPKTQTRNGFDRTLLRRGIGPLEARMP